MGLNDHPPAVLDRAKKVQLDKIEKTGVVSFDFETVIDTTQDVAFLGNVRPVMMTVYGYYYRDKF